MLLKNLRHGHYEKTTAAQGTATFAETIKETKEGIKKFFATLFAGGSGLAVVGGLLKGSLVALWNALAPYIIVIGGVIAAFDLLRISFNLITGKAWETGTIMRKFS